MSALARYFKAKGYKVAGYDRTLSALTQKMQAEEEIRINYIDEEEEIPAEFRDKTTTLVVYLSLIHILVTASNEGENIVIKPRRISYSSVPNVKGMGLRDALYVLENSGLKVDFSGAGMVQRQSLQPGAEVPKGSYIRIELR